MQFIIGMFIGINIGVAFILVWQFIGEKNGERDEIEAKNIYPKRS